MTIYLWLGFLILVFILLALDLGVFHKKDEAISTKAALLWTGGGRESGYDAWEAYMRRQTL